MVAQSKSIFCLIIFNLFLNFGLGDFIFQNYKCSVCLASFDEALEKKIHIEDACMKFFTHDICKKFSSSHNVLNARGTNSRTICKELSICPTEDYLPVDYSPISPDFDLRISKGLGSKGYDKIRVSVISNHTIDDPIFSYQSQFKYRWTSKFLSSGVTTLTPGVKNTLSIGGKSIDVFLPKQNEGVRGVIIADPCFQSEWIYCVYQNKFDMFNHSIELLNAINSHDDVQYWQILGDNFYDQAGDASSQYFASLSTQSKSKIFASVPGNHDFWVNASPKLYVPKDQLGNGFMQFYGQDTISSVLTEDGSPYDFSNNPDEGERDAENLPPSSNFFFYNQVGNVAFIGFSGAHSFNSMTPYYAEACKWASEVNPDVILLLGHWNSDGDGCEAESTVPATYQEISSLPECLPVASKIKYFMGHKHCNMVTEENIGFMVGAQGMADYSGCGGEYGIPVVDTTGGSFKVYYFPIVKAREYDNYQKILDCINANGVSGCYHLATLWSETKF